MISRLLLPLGGPAFDVGLGAGVAAHPGEGDPPQRLFGIAVTAPVESMAGDLAR